MPSKSRKSTVARRPLEDFPAEVREEAAITPSPTAVAAEAQLTGVMPLDGRQGHSAEKEIPGEEVFCCRFLPLLRLAWRALTGRIDRRDVASELEAQLRVAESLLAPIGMRVTHIDSHRHTHCLPRIFDVVTRVAREHGIAHVRHPIESSRTLLGRPKAIVPTQLLRVVLSRRPLWTRELALGSRAHARRPS